MLIKANLPCDKCGGNTSRAKYDNGEYCFKCGDSTRVIRNFESYHNEAAYTGALPVGTSPESSDKIEAWFQSVGLTSSYARQKGLLFEPISHAVVIPFYENGYRVGYQIRATQPCHGNKAVNKGNVVPMVIKHRGGTSDCVICEDIRSALKLSMVMDSVCLIGTSCPKRVLDKLIASYDTINLWLDGDDGGQLGAARLKKKIGMQTLVRNILTTKDPKCYTVEEIKERLS